MGPDTVITCRTSASCGHLAEVRELPDVLGMVSGSGLHIATASTSSKLAVYHQAELRAQGSGLRAQGSTQLLALTVS